MRLLFLILFTFILGVSYAQEPVYNQMRNNYQFKGIRVDSLLLIPKFNDTASANATKLDSIHGNLIRVNTKFYYRDTLNKKWAELGGSGTSIDTTSLSNRINSKADTSALNGVVYFSDTMSIIATKSDILSPIDTTSLSNRIDDKIDSLKKSTDSVYFKKNGTWYYSFKDSAGAGQNGRFGNDTATILMAKVHNDAGSTLTNGEVVYLSTSGTNADAPSVRRAVNKGDSASANTFGFVHGTINANDTGWIVLYGKIEKLNTSAFANGDIIYLDSIPGKWTKSKPKAPYHLVYLGAVIKSNAGNGSIFAKVQNGFEVSEIHDIQINNAINNEILVYSDTQKIWKNRDVYSVVDTTQLSARIDARVKYIDTASMLTPYLREVDTVTLSDRIDLKQSDFFSVLSIIGGSYKSKTLGMEFLGSLSSLAMVDGTQYFIPIYLSKADTIKGINFYQRVQGAYTADNYNGVALYSYSGGTITLIDTTANNGNLWKGTANTWQSVDFVNKVYCQKGLYYISLLYNTSLQSAGPSIQSGGSVGGTNFPQHPLNTIRIYSSLAGRTSPISSQSLTSTTSHQNNAFILIY